jgi:formate hydrogenlyase transcriptional activator
MMSMTNRSLERMLESYRWPGNVRELLQRALRATGGRIYGTSGAAALLGLRPTTLQGKLRRHGVRRAGAAG